MEKKKRFEKFKRFLIKEKEDCLQLKSKDDLTREGESQLALLDSICQGF